MENESESLSERWPLRWQFSGQSCVYAYSSDHSVKTPNAVSCNAIPACCCRTFLAMWRGSDLAHPQLDGLPLNQEKTLMAPIRRILMILWVFLWRRHEVNIFLFECTVRWIAMILGTDCHFPLRKNSKNFCDPLTSPLSLPSCQHFHLSNIYTNQ